MVKSLAVIILVAVSTQAQTAKVVALRPEDAAQAKSLDDQQKALDRAKDRFRKHIARDYLTDAETAKEKKGREAWSLWLDTERGKAERPHPPRTWKDGWDNGFIFSDDFKYVVPAQQGSGEALTSYPSWNCFIPAQAGGAPPKN